MPKKVIATFVSPDGSITKTITKTRPSYGEDYTQRRYNELRMRLGVIYRQAADDLFAKQGDFLEAHEKRAKKYWDQVQLGTLSLKDYQAWMRGQLFQERQWALKRGQLARLMVDVDEQAMRLLNKGRLEVFGENADWMNYKIERETGVHVAFGLFNSEAFARLIRDNPQMLPPPLEIDPEKDYRRYNDIIQNAVIHGILQGETLAQIGLRVAEETGEKALSTLRRDARTAYTSAMNAGSLMAMERAREEYGINLQKRWMATLDSHTRDSHAFLDGQVRDVDEPFNSLLGEIMYPGDMGADPADVWNCRCYMDEFYPEYDNERFRYDADGNYVGDVSYREWRESMMDEDEYEE